MDFVFRCPHCEQALEVDSSGIGSEIVCPSCNHVILVPPPSPQTGRRPPQSAVQPKQDRPISLAAMPKGSELLIQKAARPLEAAAKVVDKRFHVKTIRHSDCVQDGHDNFDATVSEFLEQQGGREVVSVSPVSYSHTVAAQSQPVIDYGVLIIYKS